LEEHAQLIGWALVAIGIGQGLLLFMFGLVWNRQREITRELREEVAAIWESVREHHEDTHAHGDGMPRSESLARFQAAERDLSDFQTDADNWMRENREDHKAICARLDAIVDLLMPRKKLSDE